MALSERSSPPLPLLHHPSSRPTPKTEREAVHNLSPNESSLFCHRCSTNQQIQLQLLSAFDDDDDGNEPSGPSSSRCPAHRSYDAYKTDLDRRYPILCERCRPAVVSRIKQRDDAARRWVWRRWMERGRREESRGEFSSRGHVHAGRARIPTGIGKGKRSDDTQPQRRRSGRLRSPLEALRWALIAIGPLSTLSRPAPAWWPLISSSPLYGKLPFWASSKASLLTVVALNISCAALILLARKTEVEDDDFYENTGPDSRSGRPRRAMSLGCIHTLSALQCIDKAALFKAATSTGALSSTAAAAMQNLDPLIPSPITLDAVFLTCQVALAFAYLLPSIATPAARTQGTEAAPSQTVQGQDVFDSLARSLSQVTDLLSDTPRPGDGNPGAVFGQTSWSWGPNGLPAQAHQGSDEGDQLPHPLSHSAGMERLRLGHGEDHMEVDKPAPPRQDIASAAMDWQPTPPPDPVSQPRDDGRPLPSASSSTMFGSTTFGPQKFYVPEEPIGGLEESFSKSLSLSSGAGGHAVGGEGAREKGRRRGAGAVDGRCSELIALMVVVAVAVAVVAALVGRGSLPRSFSRNEAHDKRDFGFSARRWAQERWLALVEDNVQS